MNQTAIAVIVSALVIAAVLAGTYEAFVSWRRISLQVERWE
jgi:hypothetical protein